MEHLIEALVVFISAEYRKSITNLLELKGSMPCFGNCWFGKQTVFHFSFKWIFCDRLVSATVMAIATATAAGSSLGSSTYSGDLVPVLTIIGVGVSLRHDDINFELYWSMC